MKTTITGAVVMVVGFIFFAGFYFAEVKPSIDAEDRTTLEKCQIDDVRNVTRACSKTSCNSCGCSNVGCDQLISQNMSGHCCGGSCCQHRRCQGCYRYEPGGTVFNPSRRRWHSCCTRECVSYSTESCSVAWGTCWTMTVSYEMHGEDKERVYHRECTFNDLGCVHRFYESFPSDSVKTCWHDPKTDRVTWSSPSGPGNWWVGAGFGIGFMALGLLCLCIYPCQIAGRRCLGKPTREDSSTSRPY